MNTKGEPRLPQPFSNSPFDHLARFWMQRAREVGVTEQQVLQMLGFKAGVGPLETLLSGRPASETLPEIAQGIVDGTGEVIKATRGQVEAALPVVIPEEHKTIVKKLHLLDGEGLRQLDVYLNFLIAQGMVKR